MSIYDPDNAYWSVEGYYIPYGWEEVTAEENRAEAYNRVREYRENEPHTSFRVLRRTLTPQGVAATQRHNERESL